MGVDLEPWGVDLEPWGGILNSGGLDLEPWGVIVEALGLRGSQRGQDVIIAQNIWFLSVKVVRPESKRFRNHIMGLIYFGCFLFLGAF